MCVCVRMYLGKSSIANNIHTYEFSRHKEKKRDRNERMMLLKEMKSDYAVWGKRNNNGDIKKKKKKI